MKRYPVGPLIRAIERRWPDLSDMERSVILGYQQGWLGNIRLKDTIREDAADRAAIAADAMPHELWPTWFDDAADTKADPTDDPRCGTRSGQQAHYRRGEAPCAACRASDRERKRTKAKKEAAA